MDYKQINRNLWNLRTEAHIQSDFYDNEKFVAGKSSLQTIELSLLGNIRNLRILHLQCHFGQDSISLARMGAEVTGVDLSDRAIEEAKKLAKRCEAKVEFICSDLYELQENHESMYDMLFTTYGTIGWLPDLAEWADVVAHFLRPGGRLVFVDFHPFIWMYDQNFETIEYSYFKSEPIIEEFEGSYASEHVEKARSISWNHGISEVFQALNNSGLHISEFREYDYSPYRIFNEMYERSEREFLLSKFGNKLPLVYSILAEKY